MADGGQRDVGGRVSPYLHLLPLKFGAYSPILELVNHL